MCYPKPAPRCSPHAIANLERAEARVAEKPTKPNKANLAVARKEYYTSPAGIKELKERAKSATDPVEAEQYRKDAEFYSGVRKDRLDAYKRKQKEEAAPKPEAVPVEDEGYRMVHRAPRPGSLDDAVAPLHQLDQLYGDDLYDNPHHYPEGGDREVVEQLRRVRGYPDAKVTIYRALPTDQTTINDGDWVALSREYAEGHAKSNGHGKFHVIKATVPASQVWSEGNSLAELGYAGESLTTEVVR